MDVYKFMWGYTPVEITATSPRNAVLKFRQLYDKSQWDIWYVLPKERTFVAFRDYYIGDAEGVLYYDCDVKPVY